MLETLKNDTLLILFLVIAVGYFIGKIRIKGFQLGVSAVLFVGLGFGALEENIKIPDIIYSLGLILFVYTIGLQSGPSFFSSFNKRGLMYNLLTWISLTSSLGIVLLLSKFIKIKSGIISGVFCGSLTNTPALATIVQQIKTSSTSNDLQVLLTEPVIGYSISYPFGVVGVIVTIYFFKKILKVNYEKENQRIQKDFGIAGEEVTNEFVLVTNPQLQGWTIEEIFKAKEDFLSGIIISRLQRGEEENIVDGKTKLELNDKLTLVGTKSQLEKAIPIFGKKLDQEYSINRLKLDYRRIFVSNPNVIGIPIYKLELHKKFKATITRLKRGDIDIIPNPNTILEAGDRIRVVAVKEELPAVAKFFGDSFTTISHIDYISVSLGIAIGLVLGSISIPVIGGGSFKLGFAGGPLIASLILGKIGRTGSIIWTMPYNANLTLRQMGVVLFLAGIGLKSGFAFAESFLEYGASLFFIGALVTFINSILVMGLGHFLFQIPFPVLIGVVSGIQTQPAVLAYAQEDAKTDAPNLGYSIVYFLIFYFSLFLR